MIRLTCLCLLLLFSSFSCSEEELSIKSDAQPAPIYAVDAPASASVNEPVAVTIGFTVTNGCGRFGHLEAEKEGNMLTILVYPDYEGEICTQALINLTTTYTFTPTQKGTYTLRFWQEDNKYLHKTITVN